MDYRLGGLLAQLEFPQLVVPRFGMHLCRDDQRLDEQVTEILEPFGKRRDAGFFVVQFELQLFENAFRELHGRFGFRLCLAEDQKVVGEPYQFVAFFFNAFVELVEEQVRQHGGDGTTLRNPPFRFLSSLKTHPFFFEIKSASSLL